MASWLVPHGQHKIETFNYQIKTHDETSTIAIPGGEVSIVFVNGKFDRCNFPFRGNYTREQWALLTEIQKEIEGIIAKKEADFKK